MRTVAFLAVVDSPWLLAGLYVGTFHSAALGWLIAVSMTVLLLLLVAFMRGANSSSLPSFDTCDEVPSSSSSGSEEPISTPGAPRERITAPRHPRPEA